MTFVLMGIFGYYYFKGGWWWIPNINWQFLAFFSKFLHHFGKEDRFACKISSTDHYLQRIDLFKPIK